MAADPDWRMAQLERRLDRVEPIVTDVAVIKSELRGLRHEIQGNTKATHELSQQIEKAQVEPINRWRQLRAGIITAVVGATVGGLFVLAGVLLSAH